MNAEMPTIERVRLRKLSPTLAFADVRLAEVNLHGMRVELDAGGGLKITAPVRTDARGREWPSFSLQPGVREEVHRAIASLWSASGES
jgi:hypothetical protein